MVGVEQKTGLERLILSKMMYYRTPEEIINLAPGVILLENAYTSFRALKFKGFGDTILHLEDPVIIQNCDIQVLRVETPEEVSYNSSYRTERASFPDWGVRVTVMCNDFPGAKELRNDQRMTFATFELFT